MTTASFGNIVVLDDGFPLAVLLSSYLWLADNYRSCKIYE